MTFTFIIKHIVLKLLKITSILLSQSLTTYLHLTHVFLSFFYNGSLCTDHIPYCTQIFLLISLVVPSLLDHSRAHTTSCNSLHFKKTTTKPTTHQKVKKITRKTEHKFIEKLFLQILIQFLLIFFNLGTVLLESCEYLRFPLSVFSVSVGITPLQLVHSSSHLSTDKALVKLEVHFSFANIDTILFFFF